MYFDFCVGGRPADGAKLVLDTIFHILGDSSYNTPRKKITPGKTYFVCTTNGEGVIQFDGQTYAVKQGECMFMRPQQDFCYRCAQDAWHFWWFEFFGETPLFCANQIFSTPIHDFKINLFKQSLTYAKEERWDIAQALFEASCGMIHHTLRTQGKSSGDKILRAAEQHIRENIESVSVAQLCTVLQVSERTLRNLFYRAFGLPPKQIITRARMGIAQQMLESTVLPISSISAQLGFSNQFHFSRAFKGAFGMPPNEYRRAIFDR